MKRIAVFTKDEYLAKKISLVLSENYECTLGGNTRHADYVIWDIDTMGEPLHLDFITVSRKGGAMIRRPFSLFEIETVISQDGKADPLNIDSDERCVRVNERKIALTDIEFSLFTALFKRGGSFVSREELNREVWGRDDDGSLLNVYVHYLREKLEVTGEKIIISSRKYGYKIDERFFEKGGRD